MNRENDRFPDSQCDPVRIEEVLQKPRTGFHSSPSPSAIQGAAKLMEWMAAGTSSASVSESARVLITGGTGVSKTRFIETLSRSPVVSTALPVARPIDRMARIVDMGVMEVDHETSLHLLEMPPIDRDQGFSLWGYPPASIGAVILVDTQRVKDCFPFLDYFEKREHPYVVAVNQLEVDAKYDESEIRHALDLSQDIPLIFCDPLRRISSIGAVLELVELALSKRSDRHPIAESRDLEIEYAALCRMLERECPQG